jgi:hypothetical protein
VKAQLRHVIECLRMKFGGVIEFIEHLQNVTTNNYDSLIELHTTAYIKSQSSLAVSWYRLPTADVPLALGFRTVPYLSYQLLTSHN